MILSIPMPILHILCLLYAIDPFSCHILCPILCPILYPIYWLQVLGIQALGGTGALRLGADLLHQQCGKTVVYVTDPTWGRNLLHTNNYSKKILIKYLLSPSYVVSIKCLVYTYCISSISMPMFM